MRTTKARLRRNYPRFMVYRIAHALGMDEEVVRSWPIKKLQGWITYFMLDNDLQKEAMEDGAREERRKQRQAQSPKPGYGPFKEISIFDLPDPA